MPPGRWGGLAVLMVACLVLVNAVPPASATTPLLAQTMPTITAQAGGPPCVVGGNPDDRLCVSSDQDNVPPPGDPWISAVRYNSSRNWTLTFGAWIQNHSALAVFSNVRSVDVNLGLDQTLHRILNDSEDAGGRMTWNLEADTPYIDFTVAHIAQPEALVWRGSAAPYRYSGAGGGTLSFTLTFTNGALWFDFPSSGIGGPGAGFPVLAGLTNFPPWDILPDVREIAAFSCENVTLTDPRPTAQIAGTRIWLFDWGDGTPLARASVPTATHLYGSPGVYRVTMTVQAADGTSSAYAGTVDTTAGACALHIARSVGFVALSVSFAGLLAASLVLPKRTKKQKRRMRRRAVYALAGAVILVVIL